jgi:hypothetical protein
MTEQNMPENNQNCRSRCAYAIAVIGAFLIVGLLVWAMRHLVQVPPLNAGRAAERAKALGEVRAADADALQNTAWIDRSKGLVRLRVDDSMQLVEREWKNPAAARSNLIARVEKANPAPAAPPPAKPSEFE